MNNRIGPGPAALVSLEARGLGHATLKRPPPCAGWRASPPHLSAQRPARQTTRAFSGVSCRNAWRKDADAILCWPLGTQANALLIQWTRQRCQVAPITRRKLAQQALWRPACRAGSAPGCPAPFPSGRPRATASASCPRWSARPRPGATCLRPQAARAGSGWQTPGRTSALTGARFHS